MQKVLPKIFLAIVLMGTGLLVNGQKHDYFWLFGYGNGYTSSDTMYGTSTLNFNCDTPCWSKKKALADFFACNLSYCDVNGNLLFYSNCTAVFDRRDSVMQNGDSTDYSYYWWDYIYTSHYQYSGLSIPQGMLALPAPGDSNKVYISHYSVDEVYFDGSNTDYPCDSSFYSLVDLRGNGGLGSLVKKNVLLNYDTLAYGNLSATKHGNGRDWWILHPHWQGNNCYNEFLLTDTGMGFYGTQCLGSVRTSDTQLGGSCFSPDGTKYFWADALDTIRMFDFDRCTGLLSNPKVISFPFPAFVDSEGIIGGVAVSPNNRFLYVISEFEVLQYDLQASNISASVRVVGAYDGFLDFGDAATFLIPQLGPDGKIYINSLNPITHLHVISQPDLPGDSCQFTQHSVNLGIYNETSIPNFPNYRLGALTGSPCDTLSALTEIARTEKEKILKVYPNPSTDYAVIDYGFTDWNKGEISLQICNEVGQTVFTQPLPMYSGYQKIDVSNYQSGIYTAYIIRSNAIVAAQKFVKQ